MTLLLTWLSGALLGACWGWALNDWLRARRANRIFRAVLADLEARATERQALIDALEPYELEPVPHVTIHHN